MSSSSTSAVAVAHQAERILEGRHDNYGGVIVEMASEPLDPCCFRFLLRASLSQWRQQGKRGVWIKMPIELVNLVEPAVKEGFYFHHAEPKYLMLVNWLPGVGNTLPANASHQVGFGAFVLNEKNEVLVVQEKSGKCRGTGIWKFPTGVFDEGEDICDAAVREVKEETGTKPPIFFQKSDLCFMCMLQPLSMEIHPQEAEIEAAQWMPYEEFAAQPFIKRSDLSKKLAEIFAAKRDGKYSGFSAVPLTTGFHEKNSVLYVGSRYKDSFSES